MKIKCKLWARAIGRASLAVVALLALVTAAGCSDDEPSAGNAGSDPAGQVNFDEDLLHGGLVYVAEYSEADGFRLPLRTRMPVRFEIFGDTRFTVNTTDADGTTYLTGRHTGPFTAESEVLVMRAVNMMDSKDYRHFIVVVVNKDIAGGTASRSTSSNMTRAYGDILGMGTQSFEMLGNTKRAVLQSSRIPVDDQNLVTSQVLDLTEMFEITGESFRSSMESWALNAGLSFKGLGSIGKGEWKMSGCMNFGINKSVNTSDDFEYYLNVYKVVRGEIAYNMEEFEDMAASSRKDRVERAKTFMTYVSAGFIRDIMEVENSRMDTEEFYDTWGTDMINQAQLGGFKIYMYGRETNVYETTVAADASLDLRATKPQAPAGRQWYDIYRAKNSPYIGGNAAASYMNDEYYQASKRMSYSLAVGGNPSLGDDPDSWINGFESVDENVKWQPISYRRRSDSSSDTSKDVWCLYPIEDMGTNVINAVETIFKENNLSHKDSVILRNARANVEKITSAKQDYVERHLSHPANPTRLVLCDVLMKYDKDKQASGEPEPYVTTDPRDPSKKRIYYPMMANKYFDYKRSTEHQRGHAIDTNVDCFIVGAETGSHYWYYTLAHENDCEGLIDITFYDHNETDFVSHGDPASTATGLLNYAKTVRVKYYDAARYPNAQKITAFGIFDDHREVNNIIASTGGSELALDATGTEQNEWTSFWSGCYKHHDWPKYAFYHGGGSIPHGIYPAYTTKDLPISSVKNITHPQRY